jgi:UDP-N-acetylmuramoyl-L-alanyl-D-glutamate--2,6-diaminopimelate ligase
MSDASTLPAGLKGLTADSRAVRPGYLFAALPGARADGRGFIADALAAGATAILAPEGTVLPPGATATLVTDANPRRRLALMAAGYYRLQPATIAAVTGTSGKTSTVNFARQLWTLLGHQAASVGTLGVMAPGRERYGSLTTPDPVALHAELADLAASGVTKLAMEASSHGLDQFRLDGVRVTLAAFTNFTQDHLDYHPTMAEYLAAKARLFDQVLQPGGTAVINADIPEAPGLVARARGAGREVLTFGRAGQDFRMDRAEPLPHGIDLEFTAGGRSFRAELPLVGGFQAYNVLCALALVVADGADLATAAGLLAQLKGIPGRVELVASHPNGAPVYVDYSHKPGALETVLTALRAHTPGALVVVFGCGGDRDKGKRPLMGEIAARFADRVIVTDDNPRSEQPAEIRRQVMAGCPGATEIGDRAEAIRAAVEGLSPGDVLVVAGKGHETGQIIGDDVRPFDDAEQARQAVTHVKSDPRWRRTP